MAYPNYVMAGVIDGFPEMAQPIGLRDVIKAPQIRGLWTWSRGGGWWGPFIHGNEQWIDLHVKVLLQWWAEKGAKTELEVFTSVTPTILPGCTASGCVRAFRNFSLVAADVVLKGQWGTVGGGCGDWMRDDRIGGLDRVGCLGHLKDPAEWSASLAEKEYGMTQSAQNLALYEAAIKPAITDPVLAATITVSASYASYLYTIVYQAWKLLQYAYRRANGMNPSMTTAELATTITAYDGAWGAYRAFGLAEVFAPSLYHPYYLCLGTTCNGAFNPPSSDQQPSSLDGKDAYGIGHTVDALRNITRLHGCAPDGFECTGGDPNAAPICCTNAQTCQGSHTWEPTCCC